MIVRCGRCRTELEVAGPGEFACPACGTRNVVRGDGPADPFDLSGLRRPSPPTEEGPPPGVRWITCPECRYRFAAGEIPEVTCPSCATALAVSEEGVSKAGG